MRKATNMYLIIGLGNPGKKYEITRHNVGFLILNEFAKSHNLVWEKDKKAQAEIVRFEQTILVKPRTFMNKSGLSVAYLVDYYKIAPENLLVVHDELDLDFGQTKLQRNVGAAGHLGVEDIVVSLKTKGFWRFRVGIGRPKNEKIETEDWVLSKFTSQELDEIRNIALPVGGFKSRE